MASWGKCVRAEPQGVGQSQEKGHREGVCLTEGIADVWPGGKRGHSRSEEWKRAKRASVAGLQGTRVWGEVTLGRWARSCRPWLRLWSLSYK